MNKLVIPDLRIFRIKIIFNCEKVVFYEQMGNWIRTLSIGIAVTLLISLIPFQNSLQISHVDAYLIHGATLPQNPTMCAIEPNEPNIKNAWKDLSAFTRNAILDWEHRLNQATGRGDPWNIELKLIPFEQRSSDALDNCDVVIKFFPKPPDEEKYKVAGTTNTDDLNKIITTIYYLDIEQERTVELVQGYYGSYNVPIIKYSYSDRFMPETPLMMIIKHELGHALGLGHYIVEDENRLQRWYDGIERPPSIMIPIKPIKIIDASITQLDIEKVISIYGREGFNLEGIEQEASVTVLPDWVKNSARWWADGLISDGDFTQTIQYLIQNKIMVIPVGDLDYSDLLVTDYEPIPEWIQNNAGWWADGLISDGDFISGIKYLVEQGIIEV